METMLDERCSKTFDAGASSLSQSPSVSEPQGVPIQPHGTLEGVPAGGESLFAEVQ